MANLIQIAMAAVPAEGAHEAAEASVGGLLTAPWFIAAAMVVVIIIMLFLKVPKLVAGMLDDQIADIRKQIDEAARLRTEAETLRKEYEAKSAAAATEAAALVEHAKEEAADLVVRRRKMAEDKIAAAERAAVADIRATAVNAATGAATALIAANHGAVADKAQVDAAIQRL